MDFAATSPAVAADNLGEWICSLLADHGIHRCRECGCLMEPDRDRLAVMCRPCAEQDGKGWSRSNRNRQKARSSGQDRGRRAGEAS